MENKNEMVTRLDIENRIYTIRGVQVMIDKDLAEMYDVETKVLNQAVKRNLSRFPISFRFQITESEYYNCSRSQNVTLNNKESKTIKRGENIKYLPYAYTEQGVAMLSAVLRSETAVKVSIQIIQAFVEMRKFFQNNAGLLQRMERVETKLIENDSNFERIFKALESGNQGETQNIYFNGQIYDAYSFIIQQVEKASKEILIIDNYVDNSVLDMLSKKKKNVDATIVTQPDTRLTAKDIQKFNQQYPTLSIKHSTKMHDRFLLLDKTELYHIGASLKDLGKKCFAFSLIEDPQIISNLLNNI